MHGLRPTRVEIDLASIKRNALSWVALGRRKGLDVIAVVKADAYGHWRWRCRRRASS
jgi:alanine racemase